MQLEGGESLGADRFVGPEVLGSLRSWDSDWMQGSPAPDNQSLCSAMHGGPFGTTTRVKSPREIRASMTETNVRTFTPKIRVIHGCLEFFGVV
jgi:hypothetical protein